MTRVPSREELRMQELMLKKLSDDLRQRLTSFGGYISVNLDDGSYDVVGCPDDLKAEVMDVLKQE